MSIRVPYHRMLLAALLCVILTPATALQEAVPAIASTYTNPAAQSPDVPACDRVDDVFFEGAILVGDSMVDGIGIHSLVPKLQLLSRIGMTPRSAMTDKTFKQSDKDVTLARKIPAMRPSAVYIWLGANALVGIAPERVIDDYARLLDNLLTALPDIPFYLIEVTPVIALTNERYKDYTNERIDTFNAALRDLAKARNVYLLPVNALLRNDNGLLEDTFAAEDGIHLRRPAYEILTDYLYTHALPETEPSA